MLVFQCPVNATAALAYQYFTNVQRQLIAPHPQGTANVGSATLGISIKSPRRWTTNLLPTLNVGFQTPSQCRHVNC